jgi:ubiquinone/menaquinone biosynthesis C-methylase UbiE
LLHNAYGRVVELGAGTGLNLRHYPDSVAELVLSEPEPGMRGRLARRMSGQLHAASIIDAPAEQLPMADASVDTVVSTLVLCTVADPVAALREIRRVLRPDGQLLFIEHVRSGSRLLAAYQDRMVEPWRHFAGGCICNRATLDMMRAAGFAVTTEADVWHGMPAIVHPLVVGRATA